MNPTETSSTAFVKHTRTTAYLAINEHSGYVVTDAAAVKHMNLNGNAVATYIDQPVHRSSRKARVLTDPTKQAALKKARQKISDSIDDNSSFSLVKLRLQAGLSQAKLASMIESKQPAIARLEKGEIDPGVSTVMKVAAALGVPVEQVLHAIIATKNALTKK